MASSTAVCCTQDWKQLVCWQAGDALFIPEGWWHQVDSQDMTIAVNFWWRSAFSKSLQPHMYAYYLRRIMDSLLDAERHKALQSVRPHAQLQTLYQGMADTSKGLTSETDDVSSADGSLVSLSEASSASQSASDATSTSTAEAEESGAAAASAAAAAAAAATQGPKAAALSPDSPDVSGRGQIALPSQLQHTGAMPDLDAATTNMLSTSQPNLCCEPDTSFPEMPAVPGSRKRKASPGRATAIPECGTAEPSGCSLHDSDGKPLEQPALQRGCMQENGDQQQREVGISGNEDSEDHDRHQDKKLCRTNCCSPNQPVLSRLHTTAMGLLAGAVNDSVSLEQQSEDEAGEPVQGMFHSSLIALACC